MRKMDASEVDHEDSNDDEEATDKEESDNVRQQDKTKSVVWVHFRVNKDGKTFVCIVNARLLHVMGIPLTCFRTYERNIRTSTK